jgi:2-succinyl-6-hydroxy-2,4-cyclohexadiene-1-carboxylate synthase
VTRSTRHGSRAAERDIDVGDGLHLHVVSSGAGPHLLALHGFTGSAATWAPLRDAIDDRFTIHAIDLPGHGRSAAPDDPARYSLPRFAGDMARVLDALGIDRAAVLGYSLGARAALRFALEHQARVTALLLESVSPGIVDVAAREERRRADAMLADAVERDGIAAFVDRWERLPLWASQAALPDQTRAALRAQRLTNQPRGLANSLRGAGSAGEPSVLHRLGEVKIPTLLIAGALDTKYVTIARTMEDAMPHARSSIVADAGHAIHLERPDAFATLVADFLGAVR